MCAQARRRGGDEANGELKASGNALEEPPFSISGGLIATLGPHDHRRVDVPVGLTGCVKLGRHERLQWLPLDVRSRYRRQGAKLW